jgi:hypothetical protein
VPFSVRFRNQVKQARIDYPIAFPLGLFGAVASLLALGILAWDEYNLNEGPNLGAYPEAVERNLRVALHYTHVRPDADAAIQAFQSAMLSAEQSSMDPYSQEFIGLRIRYSEMLEKFGRVAAAVEVLDLLTKDCEEKLSTIDAETSVDDTTIGLRKRLLKGIIQYRVKMASLYETDYLQDMSKAKETLSDAVGILVKETQDPQTKGFSENNAADMSFDEISAMLSQMGDLFAVTGEEANAVQVYMLTLQPLRAACNGSKSCREAQVLSNIASTMDIAAKRPNAKINGKPATKDSLLKARQAILKWADHAVAVANQAPDSSQDAVCQMALISARMTKSDVLLELGDKAMAKQELTGLIPILEEKGLAQLIPQAQRSLQQANA